MQTSRVPLRKAPVLIAIAALLATLGVPAIQAATELARVNGTSISLEEFNKKYRENLKFFQFKTPSKQSVLDDIVKRELGIQEARRMGLDKDPEIIDRMNTVLYHALLDKKLSKEFEGIHVTDDEARDYYQKFPRAAHEPYLHRASPRCLARRSPQGG